MEGKKEGRKLVFKRPVNHDDYIGATPAWTLNAVLYKVKRKKNGGETNKKQTKKQTKKKENNIER